MILTVFAKLFTPQMATATVVVPVADRDMTQQASVIVVGKITKLVVPEKVDFGWELASNREWWGNYPAFGGFDISVCYWKLQTGE
jgi:hypothetical protein